MSRMYNDIKHAINSGKVKEPFTADDFKKSCKGYADLSYWNFLNKHRKDNPGEYTEYFEKLKNGKFKLL